MEYKKCTKCNGSGEFQKAEKPVKCLFCNGTGEKVEVFSNTKLSQANKTFEKGSVYEMRNKFGAMANGTVVYFFPTKGKLKGFVNSSDIMVHLEFGKGNYETRRLSELNNTNLVK